MPAIFHNMEWYIKLLPGWYSKNYERLGANSMDDVTGFGGGKGGGSNIFTIIIIVFVVMLLFGGKGGFRLFGDED